jgi:hypothetical protein
MISRRGLFGGGAAAPAIGAVAAPVTGAAQGTAGVKDLTHSLDEDFPTFGGARGALPGEADNHREGRLRSVRPDDQRADRRPRRRAAAFPGGRHVGIEALANLEQLPPVGTTRVGGGPEVRGGTGGPARVFALT